MNWVDFLIIFSLIFFAYEGIGRSFIAETFDFFAFLLAFFVSLRFYNIASGILENFFHIPHAFALVLGFMAVWMVVEVILFFITKHLFIKIQISKDILYKLNKFAFLPSFLRGFVFLAIVILLFATFPIQPTIKAAVDESKIGSAILDKSRRMEGPLKNLFGGLSQETLTFLTIKPETNERIDLGFKTSEYKTNFDLEIKMAAMVNTEREKRGLKRLEMEEQLTEVGRIHSADMFERGYFSHFTPEGGNVVDRAEEKKVQFAIIGENLAYAPTLLLAHEGLMNSPGHRANILSNKYTKIGIGVQDGGVYGLMITQVFTN